MSKPFEIILNINGGADQVLRGVFTDKEHAMLLRYLEQYDQLAKSKPLCEGFPCEFSLKGEHGEPLKVKTLRPDNDMLSILLHRLRPFILQAETASYLKVTAMLGRKVDDPYTRQLLGEQRKLYDGREARQQMKISSNDLIINSEKVLYDWLNSHEYHRDAEKRESIDELLILLPGDFTRCIFISMLVDKVNAIRSIASLVAVLLGKTSNLQFQISGNKLNQAIENK